MISLSDWLTTLSLVFGGCCSNAITMERITSENPHSGVLATFFQFFIVSLYALPGQFSFSAPTKTTATNGSSKTANGGHDKPHSTTTQSTWFPRLRKRRVPLLPYFIQVALFFVLSTLNNAAFAYDIPMTVHIVFRSGGMIINMALGWLIAKKRYTLRQVLSVFIVTLGIFLTTLSASKPTSRSPNPQSTSDVSLYTQGISILSLALLLSGFLGLTQDYVFAQYIKPFEAQAASDPLSQPSWQENMFYLHSLALPLFYFSRESITTELVKMSASPSVSLPSLPLVDAYLPKSLDGLGLGMPMPSMLVYLFLNTVTQLFCVVGVNRLTGRVSSLTVTLILTVRKAVSLLLSVAVYGGQGNAQMWIGAGLVFFGTIGYSTGGRPSLKEVKDKKT